MSNEMNEIKLLRFNDFINESIIDDFNKKIIFIKISNKIDKLSGSVTKEVRKTNEEALDQLYVVYGVNEDIDKDVTIPDNMPILYYGGHNKKSVKFLKNHNLLESNNLYNRPEQMKISGSKVDFHKLFGNDIKWLPKTVFTKEEAMNGDVGFPLIAKISDGHSGLGIQKFDNKESLNKSNENFDLYSEFIDFDREYRTMFIKNKCFIVNERMPLESANKTILTKGANEKVQFIYAYQDIDKVDFVDELNAICKEIQKKIDLQVWSIDIVVDKNNNLYVLETNSATGLGSSKLCEVYKEIYEDYYNEKLSDNFLEDIYKKYVVPGHKAYWPEYKKEISKSKWPMDYKIITDENYKDGYKYFFKLK